MRVPTPSDAPPRDARRVHLASGILERDGRILLVASRYPNHPAPLWNLPGGRQRDGELLHETLRREFAEETALEVCVGSARYVSESYDRRADVHFLCIAFDVRATGEPRRTDDPHAVDLAWVARADLAALLTVGVVREPLLAHLADPAARYFGYADAGITIEFADEP